MNIDRSRDVSAGRIRDADRRQKNDRIRDRNSDTGRCHARLVLRIRGDGSQGVRTVGGGRCIPDEIVGWASRHETPERASVEIVLNGCNADGRRWVRANGDGTRNAAGSRACKRDGRRWTSRRSVAAEEQAADHGIQTAVVSHFDDYVPANIPNRPDAALKVGKRQRGEDRVAREVLDGNRLSAPAVFDIERVKRDLMGLAICQIYVEAEIRCRVVSGCNTCSFGGACIKGARIAARISLRPGTGLVTMARTVTLSPTETMPRLLMRR